MKIQYNMSSFAGRAIGLFYYEINPILNIFKSTKPRKYKLDMKVRNRNKKAKKMRRKQRK